MILLENPDEVAELATTGAATVETGAEVMVPLFINEGDKIKIETEKGTYKERIKE